MLNLVFTFVVFIYNFVTGADFELILKHTGGTIWPPVKNRTQKKTIWVYQIFSIFVSYKLQLFLKSLLDPQFGDFLVFQKNERNPDIFERQFFGTKKVFQNISLEKISRQKFLDFANLLFTSLWCLFWPKIEILAGN